MIGGLFILYGDLYGYNYLSCSDYDYNHLGTNEFLQFSALAWGHQRNLKTYLLGGGMSGKDSLFRFKAKFSPQRKDFYIGRRIHLPQAYSQLCREKMEREKSDPKEFFSRSWFPLYRSSPSKLSGAADHA
jgi:lipid II:glycine glycyltransferase (peptidoglycan interpeptide bridge formation enzyme)